MLSSLRDELLEKKIVRHGDLIKPPLHAAKKSSALWVTKYMLKGAESVDEALLQLRISWKAKAPTTASSSCCARMC
jgi:hypothetical protein